MSYTTCTQNWQPISFFYLILAFVFSPSANAQELIVEADVEPSISVTSYASRVHIGTISTGDFSSTFSFAIEANMTIVALQVLVTNLYKDSNPSTTAFNPISVNRSAGIDINAPAAKIIDGSGWNAAFSNSETFNKPEGIFSGFRTEQVKLESSQQGIFDQDVDLRVTWTQDESIKPAGRYGGYIVLYVSLVN